MIKYSSDIVKVRSKAECLAEVANMTERFITTESNIKDFIYSVGEEGYSWCGGVYSQQYRHVQYWTEQQVFAVDLDHNTRFEKILQDCHHFGIQPSGIYQSHRCKPEYHKHRVIFVCDQIITHPEMGRTISKLLNEIFNLQNVTKIPSKKEPGVLVEVPTADPAATDPARLFFSGKKVTYLDEEASFNPNTLWEIVYPHIEAKHGKNINRWMKSVPFRPTVVSGQEMSKVAKTPENLPEVHIREDIGASGIFSPKVVEIDTFVPWIGDAIASKVRSVTVSDMKNPDTTVAANTSVSLIQMKGDKWTELERSCEAYRHLLSGEYIDRNTVWCLLSNLSFIEGGRKRFKEAYEELMKKHPEKSYGSYARMWVDIRDGIENKGFGPARCAGMCQFHATCPNAPTSMVNIASRKLTDIVPKDRQKNTRNLTETRQAFNDELNQCWDILDGQIHIWQLPTGLGKTHTLAKLSTENTCFSFPTHDLKSEFMTLLTQYLDPDTGMNQWTEHLQDLPEDLQDALQRAQQLGSGTMAVYDAALLRSDVTPNQKKEIHRKLFEMKSVYSWTSLVCTHTKSLQLDQPERFAWDEDPAQELFQTFAITEEQLGAALNAADSLVMGAEYRLEKVKTGRTEKKSMTKQKEEAGKILDYIRELKKLITYAEEKDHIEVHPPKVDTMYLLKVSQKSQIPMDLFKIFDTSEVVRKADTLIFRHSERLQIGKTHHIFSATPKTEYYKKIYGDRVIIHDFGDVEQKAKYTLTAKRSYSMSSVKNNIKKYMEDLQMDQTTYGENPIICHKFLEGYLEKAGYKVGAYFGNSQGTNTLQGQNLTVLGSYHLPEDEYIQLARELGIDFDYGDIDWKMRRVETEDFSFSMMTMSDNAEIQKLQIEQVQNELKQAVGRCRPYENEVHVRIFSNVPIPGVSEIIQ